MISKKASLEHRLAAYGRMSLALAAVAAPSAASAEIITYTPDLTTTSGAIYFDFTTGQASTTSFTGADFTLLASNNGLEYKDYFRANGGNKFAVTSVATNSGSIFAVPKWLAAGSPVGANLSFGNAFSTIASNSAQQIGRFNANSIGELALSILRDSQTYYGWADISVDVENNYAVTLESFGWDGPPPVPEPPSILLLALGAAGMAAYRRKLSGATR